MSSECCGNGCNSCVLDEKFVKRDVHVSGNVVDCGYKWYSVVDIREEAENVFSLLFQKCPEDDAVESATKKCLIIPPGSHLMLRLPSDLILKDVSDKFNVNLSGYQRNRGHKRPKRMSTNDPETTIDYLSRPYSPYEYSSEDLSFRILFRYEAGDMSKRVVRLRARDLVEWKGFYNGDFKYSRNMARRLACICQGVALAPMINIIRTILDDDEEDTVIHLFACFKDFPHILLKETLREFMHFWNFKLSLFLAHHKCPLPPCSCAAEKKMFTESIYCQRINSESLRPLPDTNYLISGSEEFLESQSLLLKRLRISPANIFEL